MYAGIAIWDHSMHNGEGQFLVDRDAGYPVFSLGQDGEWHGQ